MLQTTFFSDSSVILFYWYKGTINNGSTKSRPLPKYSCHLEEGVPGRLPLQPVRWPNRMLPVEVVLGLSVICSNIRRIVVSGTVLTMITDNLRVDFERHTIQNSDRRFARRNHRYSTPYPRVCIQSASFGYSDIALDISRRNARRAHVMTGAALAKFAKVSAFRGYRLRAGMRSAHLESGSETTTSGSGLSDNNKCHENMACDCHVASSAVPEPNGRSPFQYSARN